MSGTTDQIRVLFVTNAWPHESRPGHGAHAAREVAALEQRGRRRARPADPRLPQPLGVRRGRARAGTPDPRPQLRRRARLPRPRRRGRADAAARAAGRDLHRLRPARRSPGRRARDAQEPHRGDGVSPARARRVGDDHVRRAHGARAAAELPRAQPRRADERAAGALSPDRACRGARAARLGSRRAGRAVRGQPSAAGEESRARRSPRTPASSRRCRPSRCASPRTCRGRRCRCG